jgi:hypothetical protein
MSSCHIELLILLHWQIKSLSRGPGCQKVNFCHVNHPWSKRGNRASLHRYSATDNILHAEHGVQIKSAGCGFLFATQRLNMTSKWGQPCFTLIASRSPKAGPCFDHASASCDLCQVRQFLHLNFPSSSHNFTQRRCIYYSTRIYA